MLWTIKNSYLMCLTVWFSSLSWVLQSFVKRSQTRVWQMLENAECERLWDDKSFSAQIASLHTVQSNFPRVCHDEPGKCSTCSFTGNNLRACNDYCENMINTKFRMYSLETTAILFAIKAAYCLFDNESLVTAWNLGLDIWVTTQLSNIFPDYRDLGRRFTKNNMCKSSKLVKNILCEYFNVGNFWKHFCCFLPFIRSWPLPKSLKITHFGV